MWDEMQAPVARKDFQEWAGAEYRASPEEAGLFYALPPLLEGQMI